MKQLALKTHLPAFSTLLIGLFFLLVLHFKISYTLIPLLLSVIGLGLLAPYFKPKNWRLDTDDKKLIAAFLLYFVLALISLWWHQGRGRELDLPSKLVLLLPLLALFASLSLKPLWVLYAIVCGALLAGVVGLIKFFVLKHDYSALFPAHMYIQAGGILMSLSLFCLAIAFYFQRKKTWRWFALSLVASVLCLVTCLINQARGAWVAAPFILGLLFWLNRKLISKWLLLGLVAIGLVGGVVAGDLVQKRWEQAENEVVHYFEKNNGSSSVGARLDMWKSAIIGIQEKPLFGWGAEGVKTLRQIHKEQGLISDYAASFSHAHNQYLHEANTKGLLGLAVLLALFFVPLAFFCKTYRTAKDNAQQQLWATLGVVHILSIMGYGLTQAYLAHNSGIMFFGFLTLLFYGFCKNPPKTDRLL